MTDNDITPAVRALLEALRDAMTVPLPALTEEAERAHLRIAQERIAVARIALDGVLDEGHETGRAAEFVCRRTAEAPLTYEPWSETPAAPACARCKTPFDPADTRFDGHAQHRDTPFCRSCVDRCHSSEIADHRCPVCAR